jgi:tetratricopeptide (TPR) repeat protein
VINALNNAYQFRQGLGQYDAAVANLRAFIRASDADKPEQRQGIAEANFQIAVIQIERGQKSEAISTLERFIRNDGAVLPSRAAEAYARIADLTAELPRGAERALQWYTRTLEFVAGLSEETRAALSPAALDAASKAQFMLSEQIFIRCEAIQIKGNETQVKDALRRKFELAEQAKVEFEKVMQFGRPSWMIAARTRTGMLFHTLFKAFIDAPVPDGLTPLQEEVYRTDLESRAALLKEKAMERYSKAIEVAQRTGWFNEYSEQAAARLQELDPTFKAVAEFRSSPGYDEVRFYAPEFTRPGATAGRAVLGDDASGDGASTGAPNGGTP